MELQSAARVGFTSAKFQQAFPGFKDASGSLLTGDASLEDLFAYDPATTGQLPGANIPGLEEASGGGLIESGLFDPFTGRSASGRLDSGFSIDRKGFIISSGKFADNTSDYR